MGIAEQPEPTALDHALALARHGFRVLPIIPGQKHPPIPAWQDAASADPDTIRSWFNGLYRNHGVGIATGRMTDGRMFFVLDIDDRPEHSGTDTLHDLETEHTPLPDTITSITGSGGSHVFMSVPDGRPCPRNDQSGKLGPGLDIRGEGGQVVVAPTVHPNGRPYAWEHGHAPGRIPMAEAPAWVFDLLEPEPAKPAAPRVRDDVFAAPSSPADRYNQSVTWADLLEPDGWTLDHTDTKTNEEYWTRPGKDKGTSATIGWDGNDALKVFTSDPSAPVPQGNYSKFQYHAIRHHNGDESAAARAFLVSEVPTVLALAVVPVGAPQAPTEADADPYDLDLLAKLIDWPTFWLRDATEARWIAEPVIAEGRSHAIYAPGGTGKSLFSLWLAATLATGRCGLDGHPIDTRRILYLDYEMTHDDLLERLESMGYDPMCDLSNLHYALLPSLPPADAPEGGKAIARLAQLVDAELVIIDTFSRAVSGDENDADTVRAFYRWTGLHLKAEGRAFVRIDHAGKDLDKGQRGTSAKNDDVDVVWQMTKADNGFRMTAKKRRMGWIPETLALLQFDTPSLHYRTTDRVMPAGTVDLIAVLDELDVPTAVSARAAAALLRAAGKTAPNETIRAAQKERKTRVSVFGAVHGAVFDPLHGAVNGAPSGNTLPPGNGSPTARPGAVGDANAARPPSLKGGAAQRDNEPDQTEELF